MPGTSSPKGCPADPVCLFPARCAVPATMPHKPPSQTTSSPRRVPARSARYATATIAGAERRAIRARLGLFAAAFTRVWGGVNVSRCGLRLVGSARGIGGYRDGQASFRAHKRIGLASVARSMGPFGWAAWHIAIRASVTTRSDSGWSWRRLGFGKVRSSVVALRRRQLGCNVLRP
jgi:hypothetical protein